MDRWTDGYKDKWIDRWADIWIYEYMDLENKVERAI